MPAAPEQKYVLLLEDDRNLALHLARALLDYGYAVEAVVNATEAVQALNVRDFDAVITDLIVQQNGKPVPDGGVTLIKALRSPIRSTARYRSVPIIAISGATRSIGMEHALVMAEQIGADATFPKPVDPAELARKLDQLLWDGV